MSTNPIKEATKNEAKDSKENKHSMESKQLKESAESKESKQLAQTTDSHDSNQQKDAKGAKKSRSKQHKKVRIRKFPIWLRIIVVLILAVLSLIGGLMVGYGILGNGSAFDVLEVETWQHIIDIVNKEN